MIHRPLEHPDVLAAARAEVASVVGNGPHLPPPTAEQIGRLDYLDAVIKETARLHRLTYGELPPRRDRRDWRQRGDARRGAAPPLLPARCAPQRSSLRLGITPPREESSVPEGAENPQSNRQRPTSSRRALERKIGGNARLPKRDESKKLQYFSCLSMKVRSPMPCSCSCLSPTRSQRRRRELHGADSDMAQRLETAMAHTLRLGSLAELHG